MIPSTHDEDDDENNSHKENGSKTVISKRHFRLLILKMRSIVGFLTLLSSCLAYQQPVKPSSARPPVFSPAWMQQTAMAPLTAAALSATLLMAPVLSSSATAATIDSSETAARISLNSIPPASISVQIRDLPVIGKLASGVYSKVPDSTTIKQPSIVIQSPSDKTKAIQNIVTTGHLEFDVSGVINTHLDVDVAAEKAGILNVRVASDLIPKLPFQNAASFAGSNSPTGGKESPWNMVKNMGTGEVYYYNEKTGVTQYAKPNL